MSSSTRSMQPEDIFALRSGSDAQPSPDGQRVAFVVTALDRESDRVQASIWAVTLDGASRRLADGSMPRWSPDGTRLACVSNKQICLLSPDGGEPAPLTNIPGGVTGPPVWSPDGTRIAFTARVSAAPSAPAAPDAPRVVRRLRYLLNGDGYIGDTYWHVFAVGVEGESQVQLTHGEWHHFSPAWSPDGRQVACITTRRDDWDTEWVWDVYVLDAADGTGVRRLTQSDGTCAAPAWSPDGRWIAYFDNHCPGTAYTQDYYLCLVPATGGAPLDVSRVLDRGAQVSQPPSANEPPLWSPDSSRVFFHVREAGFFHYYAYDLASESLELVRGTRDVEQPIDGWVRQPADGSLLTFAAATACRPAEVYVRAPAHTDDVRRLTDLNGSVLESLDLRTPTRLTQTSPEGWEVESWLWLPPSHQIGDAPLPGILYYHGGPHNSLAVGFNEQMHLLAAAGFAVVGVNFRGSTGFGAAFADSILRDWGPRELADGLAVVDALVEQGIVDRRRVGVYGGSYGGFMTNLALARTDRFAAGVSSATISGLHTWAAITDHWESVDWDSGGPPWEVPEYYRTHSPLTYVASITAPLLILHGEEDYRCSVAEADQLFGALRKLKRTVELVRYPGGAHAFSHTGRVSHRLDAAQRVIGWFQRYL